jgi:transcriptional regulator with XRE-family HTH domain
LSEHTPKASVLLFLGRAIREFRQQRGFSASELAAAVGVNERRLDALEAGQLDPTIELLIALSDAFGVRTAELVIRAEQLSREEPGSTGR